ncbi:MAG: hypothetical protein GWP39_11160 [Planctomycetia bacterium]|jgi:hypothetical protein|nr:hypothetical protein [Planctomycetia bacterium]NCG12772.1 hypothetical protein [Planctomycetia bacterium]NCG56432.1 hypothetical protein [Pseudomonadota bacterium]
MKNLVIVVAGAVMASVATVLLTKAMGIEAAWIGGATGGAVSGILAVQLARKPSEE